MDVLEWAIDPRGHRVPIHIAWFLIQVAFVSAVALFSPLAPRLLHAATARTAPASSAMWKLFDVMDPSFDVRKDEQSTTMVKVSHRRAALIRGPHFGTSPP